jgi:error-prone DNA polymerase
VIPVGDPFVHLHVASGYSLRYGASHPEVLVERAVEREMDTLALTDRDGTYGAIRFVRACRTAGLRPVLGVDLTLGPGGVGSSRGAGGGRGPADDRARTPVRGGTHRDPRLPRVTFLAASKQGWAAICRLVSATHLGGERGHPVCTLDLVAEHAAGRDVVALLGPSSPLGAAATARRDDRGVEVLRRWRDLFDPADLAVEVVDHRVGGHGPGAASHAARMLGMARAAGVPAVISNAVRYADRADAVVADVLDATRRLVPLDLRHLDRRNAEGWLKSGKEMAEVAEEVARLAGLGERAGRELLSRTRVVADRCAVDPVADLGIGEVHFPELRRPGSGGWPRGEVSADRLLRQRCEAGIADRYGDRPRQRIWKRLDDELQVIGQLGFASYFLTVADVCDMVREMGIRTAARGSGAGSLVNYLLRISGIDPIRHGLLMERFLSPLRSGLPDIDIDVESARRLEIYEAILDTYGGERCVSVSMRDTYRVRHALRDVGAALAMPPAEIDAIAKAFPHIRARDARVALRELPELRAAGLQEERLQLLFRLAERLDGLPRHIAMHPCGVLLSDQTLLDRTPVEASFAGFPMSQFDKDDVEDLGLLKLDVLGIRMQSAMAHAVAEIERVDGVEVDLDDEAQVPRDDAATYRLISSARTLGCFQIESPGQRELVGKSGIETFEEIVADISLFRPGPVKSDMITPYLEAKQGWRMPLYLHDDFRPILGQTRGVVVYHEQVIELFSQMTGCTLAEGDEARRAMATPEGMEEVRTWFMPRALGRSYSERLAQQMWGVLASFASFGFCKAHAAAFALPTFQSAWLKTHYPAHFYAGLLTHDPGMYPKRLILDDARHFGIQVLGVDVDRSEAHYSVERDDDTGYALRVALSEVSGISDAEVAGIVAARPYASLTEFWHRAGVSRPVVERLVLAGGFDDVYGIRTTGPGGRGRAGRVTRRDLLLQVADLDRYTRGLRRAASRTRARPRATPALPTSVRDRAAAQARTAHPPDPVASVQLTLDLGDSPAEVWQSGERSGLPEMTPVERVQAELEVLGLDTSSHVMEFYADFLDDVGVTRSRDLLQRRRAASLLVAGVKVATQTPPIRSGRRVVFLTLDDATGPVDLTFFEDALGTCATTVFHSWMLLARGELRRTGRRGVSLRATGCWELTTLHELWRREGPDAVHELMAPQAASPDTPHTPDGSDARRVLVHSSGFRLSPYADIRPAGADGQQPAWQPPRPLWHSSPGSAGR